jgi:hypothetical protein
MCTSECAQVQASRTRAAGLSEAIEMLHISQRMTDDPDDPDEAVVSSSMLHADIIVTHKQRIVLKHPAKPRMCPPGVQGGGGIRFAGLAQHVARSENVRPLNTSTQVFFHAYSQSRHFIPIRPYHG